MRDLFVLLVHLLPTVARLLGPGGPRAVIAETLLMKHQLLIMNRARRRAPNLTAMDRLEEPVEGRKNRSRVSEHGDVAATRRDLRA